MNNKLLIMSFCLVFATVSNPVYAYLDPGTGSMIVQGLLAGIAMSLMAIKMYWQKLLGLFNSIFRKNAPETSDADEI